MKVVQELVAYFDRRERLSRRQLRKLLEQNFIASDAPASMHGLCDVVGATYYFRVVGAIEGQLWGTDIYSRDSTIGAAAVHAGLLLQYTRNPSVDRTSIFHFSKQTGCGPLPPASSWAWRGPPRASGRGPRPGGWPPRDPGRG